MESLRSALFKKDRSTQKLTTGRIHSFDILSKKFLGAAISKYKFKSFHKIYPLLNSCGVIA